VLREAELDAMVRRHSVLCDVSEIASLTSRIAASRER